MHHPSRNKVIKSSRGEGSPGTPKNNSEQLFADYLTRHEYTWEYEPDVEGKVKKPDFRAWWSGSPYYFEVKERAPAELPNSAGAINPYKGIRRLIDKARKKLNEFNDRPCALVIYNDGDFRTPMRVRDVFGAMLGDLGFTLDLATSKTQSVFLPQGGSMVRYANDTFQNTTISAVLVLREVTLRNADFERRIREEAEKQGREKGRELLPEERAELQLDIGLKMQVKHEHAPRVIVCENPGAARPLSGKLFAGPFDERYGLVDDRMAKIYQGDRVSDIQ